MPVHNADIASVVDEIADLLDISGDNPFRIRAYRNASRTVLDLGRELQQMVEEGEDLTALPGIGDDLAKKIADIVRTGTTPALDKLRKEVPAGIVELLRLPGLGPKRVKMLWKALKIESVHELEAAARDGRVRQLDGFGEKTSMAVEYWRNPRIFARSSAGARWTEATFGLEWSEALSAGYIVRGDRDNMLKSVSAQFTASGHKSGTGVMDRYRFDVFWRAPIYKDWLFYVINPEVTWADEYDWRSTRALILAIDMYFSVDSD